MDALPLFFDRTWFCALGRAARRLDTTALLAVCLLSLAACSGDDGGHDDGALVVSLANGKVQGDPSGDSRRFLKIPYAKPPVGPLRWKAPQPADAWSGTRHELAFAEACPQTASVQGAASNNEDCLYLNVWTPTVKPTKAPVMVWIHGGGNFAGSAGDKVPDPTAQADQQQLWYDGQFLAARRGVVVVSMNYRLGPLGFFAHPALAAEGSPLGNQGLYDQQQALSWVHDNIEKFGGDPANVTIFGESAGSSDVCFHVVSPKSRGLFQRAISESGGCTISIEVGKNVTAASAAPGADKFAAAVGCAGQADVLACLRGKTTDELMAQAMQPNPSGGISAGGMAYTFEAVVDGPGGFVPDDPRTLFATGNVAKVPYLLGSNNDEGTLFLLTNTNIPTDDASYLTALTAQFGASAAAVAAQYPVSKYNGSYRDALARAIGDSGLVCGTHDTARRAAAAGLPVFMYNFDVPWSVFPSLLGAAHSSEISHVFGDPYRDTPADQAISDAMGGYWTSFASTGDPNGAGAPIAWPKFAPTATDSDQRLQIDTSFSVVTDFRKEECAFWRGIYDAAQ